MLGAWRKADLRRQSGCGPGHWGLPRFNVSFYSGCMGRNGTTHSIAAIALVAGLLAGCTTEDSGSDSPTQSGERSGDAGATSAEDSDIEVIARNLESPWSIAFHDATPIVSERDSGRILEIAADGSSREVGVVDGVQASGEGGLLGLAIHEKFLYAYYTAANDNRIDRFSISGEQGSLQLGDPDPVLSGIPSASFHNGGRISFGPDDMLYATSGDAGASDNAQDKGSLSGKILRMTPEGQRPADNPFPDSLVYSFGHRNPQGLDWDKDGTLYASEFGQDTWDELNVIEAGGNYGWPEVEGIAENDDFIDPVQTWKPADASPSGLVVVGESIFVANLRGERLRDIPMRDLTTATEFYAGEFGRLRDVAEAPDGSVWVLTNNTDGRGDPAEDDDRIIRVRPGTSER